ncbi:hypothetical protein [Herbaspirillum sp. CAH-3]|uniref:hypothetical protein n=1 Tax=Herbaspirillum sp. CAH-3 TaxID=2605746 RepID=UPI0012AC680A|nr:hypothetical protein [Herbaspirillum sp. CAH-3]MRT30849.1 hypothetical protein [Herbaspirillum sp. CAH-3]
MSDIKVGDLVMIVRGMPCCGGTKNIPLGFAFTAYALSKMTAPESCDSCGAIVDGLAVVYADSGMGAYLHCLKKIDPPAEGDSLPTRADLEVTA